MWSCYFCTLVSNFDINDVLSFDTKYFFQPNILITHFLSYFLSSIFYSPCFHPKQTHRKLLDVLTFFLINFFGCSYVSFLINLVGFCFLKQFWVTLSCFFLIFFFNEMLIGTQSFKSIMCYFLFYLIEIW